MSLKMTASLALIIAFASFASAALDQPKVDMTGWTYEPQPVASLSEIVARRQLELPTYGLYLWADEYVSFHDNVSKVGWKSFRIGGPFSDECMKLLATDGVRAMVTLGPIHVFEDGKRRNISRADFDSDKELIDAYVAYAEKFLKRYGPGGSFFKENPGIPNRPIMAIEIWNEPNFQYMIPDPKYPGENEAARKIRTEVETRRERLYAKLLPAAYKAVKAQWPSVDVVSFGCGAASAGDRRFFTNVHSYVDNLVDYYDVISTHPYTNMAPPEGYRVRSWGKFSSASGFEHVQKVMKSQGKIRPVWWTELGWPISQKDGGIFPDRNSEKMVTPMLQAAYVVRSYLWAMRVGADLVTTMHVTDTDGFNGGFFVDRQQQNWRPSAHAVKTLIETMPNPKLLGAYGDGADGWFAYRMRPQPDSDAEVVVAWDVAGPRTIKLPLAAGSYRIIDMLGGSSEVSVANGTLNLEIGPYPVYVVPVK